MKTKRRARAVIWGCFALLLGELFALLLSPVQRGEAFSESLGECVVEASSGRILFEKNASAPLPMASTTKILTAIMIIEDCPLKEKVVIPKEAEGVEGSSVYLKAGEEYTVEDLLYGLMLRSGNDCAVALALFHSGSEEAFVEKMNEKAALLGASDSNFCNPHGLPVKGHHTTARDLALIASYAVKNPVFETIVSTKYYPDRNWHNKNKMLWRYEGADGVKTGFTLNAGRCLVTSAKREGMKLVSVVLNSPEMYERSEELLDENFSKFHLKTLLNPSEGYEGFQIEEEFSYPLTQEEEEKLRFEMELLSPLPNKKDSFAGVVKIYLENRLIFSQNLYIME